MTQLISWPNGLGFDAGNAEIFKHADKFRIFTPERAMLVPYAITDSPLVALEICECQGLLITDLEDMDYLDAEKVFRENLPTQIHLELQAVNS